MPYKKLLLFFLFFVASCTTTDIYKNKINLNKKNFVNKGFALVFNDKLYKQKKISKKLDNRELIVFQRNLKNGTIVRIKNILNNKTIIAKVGSKSEYPIFNNAVITERISLEIDLDLNEPYIEIYEVIQNSSFVAKKAKTFDKEKEVANKAPVDSVSINDLNLSTKKKKKKIKSKFNYIIKVADFYYDDTAQSMVNKIISDTSIKKVKIKKLSATEYRVFTGPYSNINALQKDFNSINILQFENIEIIKNDKKI
mgnify:CR=1 FL=1